jgi:hypothetical protein
MKPGETYVGHDLKSQRTEISRGLPSAYRIVPISFYLTLVGATAAMGWFELERRNAVVEARAMAEQAATYQAESARLAKERTKVEGVRSRAQAVAKWVEGALNLQPVCVAINRAAGKDATITEVSLTRNAELPSQVYLELKVSNADSAVMDATLQGIRDLDFRAYSAQQTTSGELLEYKATLRWQNSGNQVVSFGK